MSERIRNAIFNSISDEVEGARVLDAFAGSGVIGLEALSRGASDAVFIERDRSAAKVIEKNIELLGCEENAKVIRATVSAWSETSTDEFDIIFADPPYHDPQLSTVSKLFSYLKPGGLMILSHPGRGEAPSEVKGIVVVDNRSYGNANLTFFRREV
jgi:16S rRNA (guanine966-N2)-methyltransferase